VFNTGAYSSWGPTVANRVPVHVSGPYRTPAIMRGPARSTPTGRFPALSGASACRRGALAGNAYDRLADKAGIDRLEFRLRNALRDGDASATGQVLRAAGIHDCLAALRRTGPARWPRRRRKRAGRGRRLLLVWLRQHRAAEPLDHPHRACRRRARSSCIRGATDIGQGSNTVIAQIAAEALGLPLVGLPPDRPRYRADAGCGKTSASRQTYVTGRAAKAAAEACGPKSSARQRMGEGAGCRWTAPLTVREGG
jgi:aldehyde oxidoreductase